MGVSIYLEICKDKNEVPISYFIKNIKNPNMNLKHHGIGPQGAYCISVPLVVSWAAAKLCTQLK